MKLTVQGLDTAEVALGTFAREVDDLRPFWPRLARYLADTAQARWPLRRRTGRLRRSLTWRGKSLGPSGVFEPTPDRMTFGSSLFYGRFSQTGTKHQPIRELIHIDPERHTAALASWLVARAEAAGLEVTP